MSMREITNDEFEEFSKKVNSSLYQTKEYAMTMSKQGFDSVLIGLFIDNELKGASLILIEKKKGFKYAYAPRGFLIDYDNLELITAFTIELKKYLAKKDIAAIKLCPLVKRDRHNYDNIYNTFMKLNYWHFGYNNFFEALKPRNEAVLELNKPYYLLFNDIKKEFRTKIRSASRNGIIVVKGNEDELDYLYSHVKKKYTRDINYFKDIYSFFSKSKNVDFFYAKLDTRNHLNYIKKRYEEIEIENEVINAELVNIRTINRPKFIMKKIASDTKLDGLKRDLVKATNLITNKPEGIVVASALVIKHKKEVYLLMDGYDKNYSSLNAKHLLVWQLIEKYSKSGYEKFNLGGIANITAEDDKFKGLNEFKLNFGAKKIEYMGDLELIINQTKYFMLKKALPIASILKK